MLRVAFLFYFLMLCMPACIGQDTIYLNGQPNWKQGMDIADHSLFYEERSRKALSFEMAKKQAFIPYAKDLRQQRVGNRPLIIQWFKFIISNTSATDTINLLVNLRAHYFIRLYANDQLLAFGGIYETKSAILNKAALPFAIPPLSTVQFYARTEDRQNQMMPPAITLEAASGFVAGQESGKHTDRYLFLLLAAVVGCLFFITLYAIYQYYLYRDKAFLWYIAYTSASMMTGLFWIDIRHSLNLFSALFHDLLFSIFVFITPVLYCMFMGSMLQLPRFFKKGWLIVKILLAIIVLQMLISFITVRTGWFILGNDYFGIAVSIVPISLLHIILLVMTALSKSPVKWFLFTGLVSLLILWCLPITGFPGVEFRYDALFVIFIFPPAYLMMGLTIEAICFSFALSYRSKLVLLERNTMQQFYAAELEKKLAERTKELEEQRIVQEEQTLKQVASAFEQKIAETEMAALRAQMNPHFIFNCLNSIKLYTLENDSKTASEYLTIFSQLIRLVLENSKSEKVTLKKELETLRLYIELEAMRFKDKVNYQISVAPEIDQQYTEIPPLLIQPYVENAIWHGLMHKKNGGLITIAVTQPLDHLLTIEITDNGVGRDMAGVYQSKSATKHKSFGTKMTAERVGIINQLYKIEADVKITDLKDDNDLACGTKVTITIPV